MKNNNTHAYLIAVNEYTKDKSLHELPQAWSNVVALHKVFKNIMLLPKENITTKTNPDNDKDVIKELREITQKDDIKNLIIYYAGHGILDDESNHYLALSNSTVVNIDIDGLDISDLNKAFSKKKNLNIILIIDSCFSEKAFENFNARNYLLMASSAKNRTTKYPVDADYSAFTNELINILKNGIDNDKPEITWREVFQNLKQNLGNKNYPIPKISTQNEIENLIAVKNNFNEHTESFDNQWINLIKNISKNNTNLQKQVELTIKSGSSQVVNELKQHLLNNIPYPIAYYLSKLFKKDTKAQNYIVLHEKIIQFISFVFLAQYEEYRKQNKLKLSNEYNTLILNFDEPDNCFYFQLLSIIIKDLQKNKLDLFISEFDFSSIEKVIKQIQSILKQEDKNIELLKKNVLILLEIIGFIVNYKLLSIKDIRLRYRKYENKKYNHAISLLKSNNPTQYENWKEIGFNLQNIFTDQMEATNSQSILFIKNTTEPIKNYINLWPLMIDENAFETDENKNALLPDIFMYAGKTKQGKYLYQNIKNGKTKKVYEEIEPLTYSENLQLFETSVL